MRCKGRSDTIHVACCFDAQMELPFLILASSLKRQSVGDRGIVLHAFHSEPLAHDAAYSAGLNSELFKLEFKATQNPFHQVQIAKNANPAITAASFLRLLLPSILTDVERVVYLDCDIVVLKDIAQLHDTDLAGLPLAGCVDYGLLSKATGWQIGTGGRVLSLETYLREVIELSDCGSYFNAGVLVMDLQKFRDADLIAAAERFLERTNGRRFLNDQCALNYVISGGYARLDPRWNVTSGFRNALSRNVQERFGTAAARAPSAPWIVHYTGTDKPWKDPRPSNEWDQYFWDEAVQSEALPLVVQSYLEACRRRGLTSLQSPRALLARGKPRIEADHIVAHAQRFHDNPAVVQADKAVVAWLGPQERFVPGPILVPIDVMRHKGGIRADGALLFDLDGVDGHLVYGPYQWFPAGHYDAVFDFSIEDARQGRTAKVVIEVVDNTDRFLAQQDVPLNAISIQDARLEFVADGSEQFFEFRLFATGFVRGTLRFKGVRLRPQCTGSRATTKAALPSGVHSQGGT
jgi:lipopolysaccharide biosynthesis glycosyltransferase